MPWQLPAEILLYHILIGIRINTNQQSCQRPNPLLEDPGNNLFYSVQHHPLPRSYNVRNGNDRIHTRHYKYSCILLVCFLQNSFLLRFTQSAYKVIDFRRCAKERFQSKLQKCLYFYPYPTKLPKTAILIRQNCQKTIS